MNKRVIIWIAVIVLLVVSLPGIFQRWQAEGQNNTYELAVPYEEIYDLTTEDTVSLDEALEALADAGVNTISFSPVSLHRWSLQNVLTVYGQREIEEALRFTHQEVDYHQDKKGFYTTVPEDPYYVKKINEHFDPVELTLNDQPLYFIPTENEEDKDRYTNLGYDEEAIARVKEYGFNFILRIENDELEEINEQTIQEILNFQDDPALSTLLFTGEEVIGFPNPEMIKQSAWQLYDAGYSFYTIDQNKLKGEQTFARATNYNTIRLISVDLRDSGEALEKAIRGVKERQVRSIFFHVDRGDPIESLDGAVQFVEAVHAKMPKQFAQGDPVPLADVTVPIWSKLAALLAGVLFSYLAVSGVLIKRLINMPKGARDGGFDTSNKRLNNGPAPKPLLPKWLFNSRLIGLVAALGMIALIGGYFVLNRLLFLQAFALAIAIVTPIYAVLSNAEVTTKMSQIIWQYIKAILISFVGIVIVVAVLNGNGFMTQFEEFRGVKLVYAVPLVVVALFVIFSGKRISLKDILKIFNAPVRYWHIIVLAIVAGIGYYYMTRTGNAGTASALELAARQWLEDVLYVRPRTKEFLIGFPFYIFALYIIGFFKAKAGTNTTFAFVYRWSFLLLVPATIGFLSIVNTFTHFHIPIHISLLRTAYSLGFGLVIGLILIGFFVVVYRLIANAYKKRWS